MNSVTATKGNQEKYVVGDWFYKVDSMGYESISEVLVSELEDYIHGLNYVDYFFDVSKVGVCKSRLFISSDESVYSLYKILKYANKVKEAGKYTGQDLVKYLVNFIGEQTGLSILKYLSNTCMLDAIIFNEDRHFNNLAVIKGENGYRECPIFDNGLSLLSDTGDYPMGMSFVPMLRKIKAKPFSSSFSKQVGYFLKMGCEPLKIDIDGFHESMEHVESDINRFVPYKQDCYVRAMKVLITGLNMTEGRVWVKG